MKRIISLLLALLMTISAVTVSFAANTGEEYYTVQVEYSDNKGHQEGLDVMVLNNNVFVDAEMFAKRLGYTLRITARALLSIKGMHQTDFWLVSRSSSTTAPRYPMRCSTSWSIHTRHPLQASKTARVSGSRLNIRCC